MGSSQPREPPAATNAGGPMTKANSGRVRESYRRPREQSPRPPARPTSPTRTCLGSKERDQKGVSCAAFQDPLEPFDFRWRKFLLLDEPRQERRQLPVKEAVQKRASHRPLAFLRGDRRYKLIFPSRLGEAQRPFAGQAAEQSVNGLG